MEQLKKIFPFSFKRTDTVKDLIIGIVVYLCVGILAGLAIWLGGLVTGWIPVLGAVVGWVLKILGTLVDIYVVAGIIIKVLVYLKVID